MNKNIKNIGVCDDDIELFEHQYKLNNGVTYNSYLIEDEKIAVLDTVDKKKASIWLENLKEQLNGKKPDYLIISHVEPDHSGSVLEFLKMYPNTKLVGNAKTFAFLNEYFDISNYDQIVVKEEEVLNLGNTELVFYMAPMVHWPEVMVTYDKTSKTLFSADGFGTFGKTLEDWDSDAKRYYYNICGKYGVQVLALLNKLSKLEINCICPLHGPILNKDIPKYIDKYLKWANYESDEDNVVIFCDSIHGNTYNACKILKQMLDEKNLVVKLIDLALSDVSYDITTAFANKVLIFASSTFNMNMFVHMNNFLNLLKDKDIKNKVVGIIENGTWSPNAANKIKQTLESLKNIEYLEPIVTIRGSVNDNTYKQLEELAKQIENII